MLFNSAAFAVFLPIVLMAYWALRGASRRWFLLLASYFFYSWCDWRFSGLLLLSTVIDYHCAIAIENTPDPARRKRCLWTSVFSNLGILCTFKYFNFFRDSVKVALASVGVDANLPALDLLVPAGISFYTFQTMSYTIDVYRGAKACRTARDFALFVCCFPQLVAGPIVRASDFLPQLEGDRRFADVEWSAGVYRLFRGLFKKMVVADALSVYVDAVFASPGEFRGISAWIGLYAYAFQIYMDFSGYSDVAIGVGKLLGLRFPENFDRPYLAVSPSDFWRRWHITLSVWLRDYLYIPLGGSRCPRRRMMLNLMITMTLGGLWHGAAWTFVAWGVFQGVLLVGEHLLRGFFAVPLSPQGEKSGEGSSIRQVQYQSEPRASARADDHMMDDASNSKSRPLDRNSWGLGQRILATVVTFHLMCLGWLLFRAPDWSTVTSMLSSMFDFTSGEVRGLRIVPILLLCWFAHLQPLRDFTIEKFARLPGVAQGALAGACMWALILFSPTAKPFIYFQF